MKAAKKSIYIFIARCEVGITSNLRTMQSSDRLSRSLQLHPWSTFFSYDTDTFIWPQLLSNRKSSRTEPGECFTSLHGQIPISNFASNHIKSYLASTLKRFGSNNSFDIRYNYRLMYPMPSVLYDLTDGARHLKIQAEAESWDSGRIISDFFSSLAVNYSNKKLFSRWTPSSSGVSHTFFETVLTGSYICFYR